MHIKPTFLTLKNPRGFPSALGYDPSSSLPPPQLLRTGLLPAPFLLPCPSPTRSLRPHPRPKQGPPRPSPLISVEHLHTLFALPCKTGLSTWLSGLLSLQPVPVYKRPSFLTSPAAAAATRRQPTESPLSLLILPWHPGCFSLRMVIIPFTYGASAFLIV